MNNFNDKVTIKVNDNDQKISPSISVSFNDNELNNTIDIKNNLLNQTTLSQPSSYQTINNISSNDTPRNTKVDFDYSIRSFPTNDDQNLKNFNPQKTSTAEKNKNNDSMGHRLRVKSINEYNRRKEEAREFYRKILGMINDSINIIKAVMMRVIFSLHSLIAISYVYVVKRDEWYFVNVVGVVFMMIELFITIIKRRGHEPTGFFPSFLIYICTMIPPIWFVELSRIEQANKARARNKIKDLNTNMTDHSEFDETDHLVQLSETFGLNESLGIGLKINEAIPLNTTTIAVYLEISLMIFIILGRWFLPKGDLSRSALSQLLLVYMSLGSDMIDLLSLLNEVNVQESTIMTFFTLSIFSWSMFQFSLNLVVNRGRSFVIEREEDDQNNGVLNSNDFEILEDEDNINKTFIQKLDTYVRMEDVKLTNDKKLGCIPKKYLSLDVFDTEMWSILITMIFQDGPFLAIRLTAVIKFEVRTFVTLFYTCKNAIILFLQCYRLSAIYTEATKDSHADQAAKEDAAVSLKAASIQLDRYIISSYKRYILLKKLEKKRSSFEEDALAAENRIFEINPIILKSALSKQHNYNVILVSGLDNALCCNCECHLKE